jgi:hypothetical protein
MLQRERKHLKQILKLENVERVKRIKEYKRLEVRQPPPRSQPGLSISSQHNLRLIVLRHTTRQTLKKIHDADERTNYMFQQKRDIIAQVSPSLPPRHGPPIAIPDAMCCCGLQRKKTSVATKIQKDALMKLVEKAKTCSGDKAVRVLQKAIKAELK